MAEEPDGLTAQAAFRSYVLRNGRAGAQKVHEVVHARGAGWLPYAAAALVLHPDEEFLDVFRAAAEDGVCQLEGRRGLSRLGRLGDETWSADAKRYGDERSLEEYREAYDAASARLTGIRLGSIAEMVREAANARVVIFSEVHHDGFVRAWEIGILQQLMHLWGGPMRTRLLYESQSMQQALIAAGEELGCRTLACEQGHGSGFDGGPVQAWNLAKRDAEAIGAILEYAADAEVRDVVAYGALHTTHIQAALLAQGVPTVRIVLSPDATMRAGAMRVVGSLKTLGKAFRYDDGTWFVDVLPYSRWGCPELDEKLEEEER